MNLYVLGDIRNAYRTQLVIKLLMENGITNVAVNSLREKSFWNKIIKFLVNLIMLAQSDVVYVCSIQHNSKLLRMARWMHKKIILEFYISFYDTDVFDRKLYTKESRQAKKLKKIDEFAIQSADKVIFLNKAEAEYYARILGFSLSSINYSIIPVCVSEKPEAKLEFFKSSKKTIDICWVGTYIPLQGVDKIIAAASILKEKNVEFRITLWGDSDVKAKKYVDEINRRGLTNYFFVNNKDWGNIKKWERYIVNNCDLTLGIFGNSRKARTVIANKVIDGLAFKTPLITGKSVGIDEYFDGKSDIYLTSGSPESIAEMIMEIIGSSDKQVLQRVQNANDIYMREFSYHAFEQKFINVFTEMGLIESEKH